VGDHDADMAGNVPGVKGKVPSRRFGYVSVVHDNKLVLFGGFDGSRWLNDMYVFDFITKTWSEIQAGGTLPSVRSCPAWAKDDTHVYIQGGYDGVERKDDFFACDLSTYTWTQMPSLGVTPSPRYFHSCCLCKSICRICQHALRIHSLIGTTLSDGSKMYLYGGYSGSQRLADMFVYDFDTNHWCEVESTSVDSPSGRSSLVAQVYENNLYIFGGTITSHDTMRAINTNDKLTHLSLKSHLIGYNGNTVRNDFYRFRLRPIGVPAPALVKDFGRLVNQPDMSDVCFLVESQEVYAHRAILAVRSEYFRALLFNGLMRESVQPAALGNTANSSAPIELGDVSHRVFVKVLEYLYTDTVKGVNLELGIHLLIASEQFLLDRLKALCEDIIRREISAENVISILITSHQHNASGLKEIALDFILRNLPERSIQAGLSVSFTTSPSLNFDHHLDTQPEIIATQDLKEEPDLLVEIIKLSSAQQHHRSTPPPIQQTRPPQQTRNVPMHRSSVSGPFGVGAEWDARR
jgi:hypothetical protein